MAVIEGASRGLTNAGAPAAGTDEVQTITITGTPTGGTFKLRFNGFTTAAIAYNAAAAAVQRAGSHRHHRDRRGGLRGRCPPGHPRHRYVLGDQPRASSSAAQKRPERVPEQVKVVQVEEARPFQEDAPDEAGARAAPEDTAAVATPTMPVLDMATTVGTGTSEYVTTTGSAGDVPVMAGPGGGRGGAGVGRGAPGPLAHQDAVGVQVSRDWQITAMPEALNDRDFEPEYPAMARHEGREAVVSVRLHIDAAGVVRHAEVIEAPPGDDAGFRASALAYVKKLRFRPARAGHAPVGARIDWTVYFYVHD